MTPIKDFSERKISLTYKMMFTIIACSVSIVGSIIGGAVYVVKSIDQRDNLNATQSYQIAAIDKKIDTEIIKREQKDKEHDDRINNFIEYLTAPKR